MVDQGDDKKSTANISEPVAFAAVKPEQSIVISEDNNLNKSEASSNSDQKKNARISS
jgi:hypothetical protein